MAITYATFDPGYTRSEIALSNGNLTATHGGPKIWASTVGTTPLDTEQGYAEFTGNITVSGGNVFLGVMLDATDINVGNGNPLNGGLATTMGYYGFGSGAYYYNGVANTAPTSFDLAAGDVIGLQYDNHTVKMFKNNVLQFTWAAPAGSWRPYAQLENSSDTVTINTGQTAFVYPARDLSGNGWSSGAGAGGGIAGNIVSNIVFNTVTNIGG